MSFKPVRHSRPQLVFMLIVMLLVGCVVVIKKAFGAIDDMPTPSIMTTDPSVLTMGIWTGNGVLAVVGVQGDVWIDWEKVDASLVDPRTPPETLGLARLMAAIRDGKAKSMGKK